MPSYVFRALPPSVPDRIRADRRDDFGNVDLTPTVADGPGFPCRLCLRDADAGESLLLFSYTPFPRPRPYRVINAIFVHEQACPRHPDGPAVPTLLRHRLLALRSYDERDHMLDCDLVQGQEIETLIDKMLAEPRARTVHVYNARAGCFMCEIVRA